MCCFVWLYRYRQIFVHIVRAAPPLFHYTTSQQPVDTVPREHQTSAWTRELYEMVPTPGPSNPTSSYDYTEGASPVDIDSAVVNSRLARRESQYSILYAEEGQGAMFAGPGHSANPSSVSRMSHMEIGRRSSEARSRGRRRSHDSGVSGRRRFSRRSSKDSQVSRQSVERSDVEGEVTDEEDPLVSDGRSGRGRSRRLRKSISPAPRVSVFENLAHLFTRSGTMELGARRLSMSQRSSTSTSRHSRRSRHSDAGSDYAIDTDDDAEERWGYSSGEEDSDDESLGLNHDNVSVSASMEYSSEPPSPGEQPHGLPLLSSDPIFGGEARIDMEIPFALLDPPPPGPPSRQTLYIVDEDSTIRFIGYEAVLWRAWVWRIGCILTLGILGLLGHWFPRFWLRWVARERAFRDAHSGFIVVEVRPSLYSMLL